MELPDWAIATANFWLMNRPDGMFDMSDFADEHSLSPQRGYAIACNVYGSDPDTYDYLVPDGVPEERAAKCVSEWEKKSKAWGHAARAVGEGLTDPIRIDDAKVRGAGAARTVST